MKKVILFSILLAVQGCAHFKYQSKKELKKQKIEGLGVSRYDLVIGIQFKDLISGETTEAIKDDLASEMANWFVNVLDEGNNFKKVVNLHENKGEEVDVILRSIIKSVKVEKPGISGTSKALAIFYGVAPVAEHYGMSKQTDSTATLRFQLIEPKTNKLLWNKLITEKVRERIPLHKSNKLIFASITQTVETLLTETEFSEELNKIGPQKRPTVTVATKKEPLSAIATSLQRPTIARHWAVIIGISQYKYSGQNSLTNLIFADDDARAFARLLRNLGWSKSHIKLLVDEKATHRNVMIALESWLTKASPNDQVVLFWAGHAYPDPEDPEKVYFACYDTDISIPATGYRMDRVRVALEERKARNVVLLADTCHAGKLITRGDRGISIVPQIDKMHREKKIPKGWIFMVGAETDRQAIEHSSWSNGAFTHCLLNGLSGGADGYLSSGAKDGIVSMGELRAFLNSVMPDQTQRVLGVAKRPLITTSTGDPDIWDLTLYVK
jgi:hypothetical protein